MVATNPQVKTPHSASAPGRRTPAAGRTGGMIRRARFMAWALTAALMGLVVFFLVQLGMFDGTVPKMPAEDRATPPADSLEIQKPRFTGFDRQNQAYEVTASSARQSETEPNIVYLESVRGELKLKGSGDLLAIVADNGVYDSESDTLDLSGNVRLTSTGQYTAQLDKAQVLLKNWRLRSEEPVDVVFSDGTIHARGIEIWDDGRKILFLNTVRGTVSGDRGKQDSQ